MSNSLRPHELQQARPPCPSPTPRVHSDLRPSSQWCHPAISSSVVPFSSCPQSLPASKSFPMSQLFTRGGQSTGVSAVASFLPKKSQGDSCYLFPLAFSISLPGCPHIYLTVLFLTNVHCVSSYKQSCYGHPCACFSAQMSITESISRSGIVQVYAYVQLPWIMANSF